MIERMNALFGSLDPRELRNVTAGTTLSFDDVCQEARLICWCIASNQSDFDPDRGSERQYIMGRLWGLALRYQTSLSLHQENEEGQVETESAWMRDLLLTSPYTEAPADPLTTLIGREETEAEEESLHGRKEAMLACLNERDRTFASMMLAAPLDHVASLYGMTVRAVRYRQKGILKQLNQARISIHSQTHSQET